ncbi:MAG: winged helix-turn-helix transcriptional regulator [Burkholderiales bacterium]|nr:winged helix-turn-helix transcriptional regulator [Burkholderiales bacterium]
MRKPATDLEQYLEGLARQAAPGDRLPPIRELMRRYGASQMVVQRAFEQLKGRGLIASQVGRGTFFRGHGQAAAPASSAADRAARDAAGARVPAVRSVLLLRRSISIVRGRVLVEGLQRRFAAEGQRVLEVSYTDPDHALTVLKGLPRFDACVIQSTYKTITVDVLAALREKSDVLAVDGAALVGADVESVGTEWGEPLAVAVERLRRSWHRRFAYATTSQSFLASELGRRRLEQLKVALPDCTFELISVARLPDEDYDAALVQWLRERMDASGRLPFTALVAWGIEDGVRFRRLLTGAGLEVPAALSVVLLGRTDLANEHADFFDIVGCRVADQVEQLHRAITTRWADPAAPYGVHLVPVTTREGHSVAAPPSAPQLRGAPGKRAGRHAGAHAAGR